MIQKHGNISLDSMESYYLPSQSDAVTLSDTSSVSTSLAPSAVGEEEFEDAETDDDDDTIEEESIISMPRARGPPSISTLDPPSPGIARGLGQGPLGKSGSNIPSSMLGNSPTTPLGPSLHTLSSESSLNGPLPKDPAPTSAIPTSAFTPSSRRGLEFRGGASFFKNLRKKKDSDEPPPHEEVGETRLNRLSPSHPETAPVAKPLPILATTQSPPGQVDKTPAPVPLGAVTPRARQTGSARPGGASIASSQPQRDSARIRPAPMPPRMPGVRRVLVKGVSPRTLQALLFYMYTNQVHFVSIPHMPPHGHKNSLHEEALSHLGNGSKQNPALWPPAFSNKAAYCLGKQLDLHDLAVRAFEHISMNLSVRSVLADLLSPFGDRFSDVQRVHLDFITQHWEEVKTRPDFVPIVENLAQGQYPKSSASLFQLFSKLSVRP